MAAAQGEIQSLHRYKLQPPYFTGDYATFEEWKHKMVAYLGLQNSEFPRLLQTAEQQTLQLQMNCLEMEQATWKRPVCGYNSAKIYTTFW